MNENESFWYHNYQVIQAQLVEYYERNQKAIEYISDYEDYCDEDECECTPLYFKELLDILKGSDKE